MDEKLARELLQELARLSDVWNKLSELSISIPDDAERSAFRRALAQLLGDCDRDLIRPLERKFPHLEGIAIKEG